MAILFESNRSFQAWRYHVSHGQLLFRSTSTENCQTQIDVLFKPVHVMKISTQLRSLVVSEASNAEVDSIRGEIDATGVDEIPCFILRSDDFRGYVLAGTMQVKEYVGDYRDQSPLLISDE